MILKRIFGFCDGKNYSRFFFLLFCWILIFSSSQINGNFINKANAQSCATNLPISGVTASSNNGNVPSNVLDNNLNTRWSNNPGLPAYITADLGTSKPICEVDIAWYLGNERFYTFTISTSTTGGTGPFTNVFSGTSSGTTVNSEKYTFAETSARYVRITVTASPQTSNQYGSMTELDIFGSSSPPPPSYLVNQSSYKWSNGK